MPGLGHQRISLLFSRNLSASGNSAASPQGSAAGLRRRRHHWHVERLALKLAGGGVAGGMMPQDKGLDQGIFVDAEGWISEGPAVNVGIITQSDTLVVPPFDTSLDGITIQRVMELIPTFQDSGDLEDFVAGGVERRPVHIDEVFEAKEVFITSSSAVVLPVVRWDDRAINDGEPGEQTLALKGMLEYDMDPANETGQHIPVPYGFLTGMEDEDYVY